ncbi:DUF4198 domain-containing protein [Blastopirellula retiformator]|uniref:Carboxypeptidase regulatory-like domain-containing protein n=1 Tax=Blastopirellula retiformator TaxID=2527970 RepID=A0A5C5V3V7_9BACT|nr:DUF4198 domain-containing protein [Blastopirellula retiformator]TWT33248.1 hypothetical protein Enr8_30730 [Blastopirellula retiformator]
MSENEKEGRLNRRVLLGCMILIGLAGGCGPAANHPELAPVTGVVTVNGKPVENVTVVFTPATEGRVSRGGTDAEGKFTLRYAGDADGAVLGQHAVTFMVIDADAPANVLPRKYADQTASIPAEVTKAGPNEYTFDLKGR